MFVISTAVFFLLIDRSYLHTFMTTMTGPQFSAQRFKIATTDLERLDLLEEHPSYYKSYDHELMAFVASNWAIWQLEKPGWFTENLVASIPDRFIPAEEVERMNRESFGGQRRRNSFAAGIGGERRLSADGGTTTTATASVSPMLE
jgi:hypothetical protein